MKAVGIDQDTKEWMGKEKIEKFNDDKNKMVCACGWDERASAIEGERNGRDKEEYKLQKPNDRIIWYAWLSQCPFLCVRR